MTYNEKKSLYESIINEVAKIVKRQINESESDDELRTMAKEFKNGNSERKTDAMLLSMAKSIVKAINNAPDTNSGVFVKRLYSALKTASNQNKQAMFVDYLKQVLKETGSINESKNVASIKPLTNRLESIKENWEDMSSDAKSILLNCIDRIIELDKNGDKEKLNKFKKAINPF